MSGVAVTVAICTWNRADSLRDTLQHFREATVPEGGSWEVLVVDNGSTDHTPSVVAAFEGLLPIRRVEEARPGLSHARNRAVAEARGRWILWTDDDVRIGANWIPAYLAAARDHPDTSFFGGSVAPHFEHDPPAWLLSVWDQVSALYAVREAPEGGGEIDLDYPPFGANFAVRADVQRRHPYDPELGHHQGRRGGMEEIECMASILRDGGHGLWVPGASVEHMLPADRLTASYLLRMYAAQAALEPDTVPAEGRASWRGVPLWLWKKWLFAEVAHALPRRGAPDRYLSVLREAALRRGQVRGLLDRRPKS